MTTSPNALIVLKLGRWAVSSADAWHRIATAIRAHRDDGYRVLVVCSAPAGVSESLVALLESAVRGHHEPILMEIHERYDALGLALGIDASSLLLPELGQLGRWADGIALTETYGPRLEARVVSRGSVLTSRFGAEFLSTRGLRSTWADATELLDVAQLADDAPAEHYLDALSTADFQPSLVDKLCGGDCDVVVTQAGIAVDAAGDVVLLGYGRDDYSAAIMAARCRADGCEFWTLRPGLFTTDPEIIPSARQLRRLDYEEAQEVASSAMTVGPAPVDPRSVETLRAASVPLHILSAVKPELGGTKVVAETSDSQPRVKAIAVRRGVLLISMETFGMWRRVGFLADIFDCFRRHGLSIDLVSTSEANVTVSLDATADDIDHGRLDALLDELKGRCRVRIVPNCAAISLIGRGIRAVLHRLGPALEVFEAHRVHLVSQAANDLNLTFVVDAEPAERVVRQLHALLFEGVKTDETFGPSWRELNEADQRQKRVVRYEWWQKRASELVALAQERSPIYVYDEQVLRVNAQEMVALDSVDRVFYAIKANDHPEVLRVFEALGLGFECASIYEVEHVVRSFPNIDRDRVLFTPNFAPRQEYERAFDLGITVTVDNLFPLKHWAEVFAGRAIFVRVDPGVGRGHHAHVKTAGTGSKFGLSVSQLDELLQIADRLDVDIVGLHAHSGSGIPNPDAWGEVAQFLAELADKIGAVTALDLGGGLSVPAKPGQSALDMSLLDETLGRFKAAWPRFQIWLEPGRFLVARAGVLLSRVTQTKQKGAVSYVGIETGMNSIIRPALYGAYHEIVNLSRIGEPDAGVFNVVGPICETGDTLGYGRKMPEAREGDVILIAVAGAYGRVMSSSYNRRPPASEVFLAVE